MVLRTTEPGVQVYTCGYLTDKVAAKAGRRMCKYGGLTFETQKFPGSPNHAHFPGCILHPGETYRHVMAYEFSADGSAQS
jgi:aldose 1-epimerase